MPNVRVQRNTETFFERWSKRFKLFILFMLPNRALKYFPPNFILKDPIVSLVDYYRRNDEQCAIILFHMERLEYMITSLPKQLIDTIHSKVKAEIRKTLPQFINEENIIGVKQYHEDDYCLFIRTNQEQNQERLNELAHSMRKNMEKELQSSLKGFLDGYIRFQTGVFSFSQENNDKNTAAVIHNAYRYTYALAKRGLPTNFYGSRKELESILNSEKITVLAQPIMDLKSGDVYGWEILTRGPKNTRFNLPTELFDFAYKADLLTELECLVMRKAIDEISNRQIKAPVFINVTSISLCHPFFLNKLMGYFEGYDGISPKQIIFEITERHSIKDYNHMALIMKKYRSYGFRFAIDDAGAGYASLQTISELVPDIIKIDKSVIQNIDKVSMKQTVLRALMFFADNINCQVIAEGVETEAEAEILFEHRVQMGQGYYFARPKSFLLHDAPKHFELMKQKIVLRHFIESEMA